jgi:hypothetical protein
VTFSGPNEREVRRSLRSESSQSSWHLGIESSWRGMGTIRDSRGRSGYLLLRRGRSFKAVPGGVALDWGGCKPRFTVCLTNRARHRRRVRAPKKGSSRSSGWVTLPRGGMNPIKGPRSTSSIERRVLALQRALREGLLGSVTTGSVSASASSTTRVVFVFMTFVCEVIP